MPTDEPTPAPDMPPAIVVYWRPGCGFCQALTWELGRMGLAFAQRNIWEDQEAAAFVRSVARGNETVPTVTVGPVAMVNPEASAVLAALRQHAPDQVPAHLGDGGGRLSRSIRKALGAVPTD